jgi:hypothetical protein
VLQRPDLTDGEYGTWRARRAWAGAALVPGATTVTSYGEVGSRVARALAPTSRQISQRALAWTDERFLSRSGRFALSRPLAVKRELIIQSTRASRCRW